MEKSNHIDMDKKDLEKLSKSELIELLLKQQKPVPTQRRPIPTPRRSVTGIASWPNHTISVKNMVQQYEDNIIQPPIPTPRTKKLSQIPIPIPEKRTIITQVEKALKNYTKSFNIQLRDKINPLIQLHKSRQAINHLFKNLLIQTKGFKFVETLQVNFIKQYATNTEISKLLILIQNRFNH